MAMPEIAHVEIRPVGGGSVLAAYVDGKYLGVVHADGEGITIYPYRKVFLKPEEAAVTESDGG